MNNASRLSVNQKSYVAFITANPGCSTADVNRACKWNPRAGHRWIYDSVGRLLKRRILFRGPVRETSRRGGAGGLYVSRK